MKLKHAVSLIALSVASTTALAAAQSTGQGSSSAFQNQQLAAMTNSTGVSPTADWYNRIKVSGLLNLDVFAQNNDKSLYRTLTNGESQGSQSAFNVSTLALNIDSQINSWVAAHVGLFYATDSQPVGISGVSGQDSISPTRYYQAGEAGGANSNINGVDVDDAYVDIMDLSKAPIDVRLGRQYFGYGSYDRYAMMPTLTQQLTEIRGTGAELNFVHSSGLHADAFGLRGLRRYKLNSAGDNYVAEDGYQVRNFGGSIGYTSVISKIGFDVSAGYLYNMSDVGALAQAYSDGYSARTGGWNVNGSLMTGPFKLGLQYVSSASKLKDLEFASNENTFKGGNPSAGNVYGSYAFKTAGYNSKLTVGYQWSKEALLRQKSGVSVSTSDFALPQNRVAAEYDVNVLKNTMLGLEVNHDTAYSKSHGGTGASSTTGIARLSVLL